MTSSLRVLVAGAQGQVGRALGEARPAGIEFCPATRAELDITDQGSVERCLALFKPDVVINAAAYTAVDKAESDVQAATRANAEGPGILSAAIRQLPECRLLHLSTDFVFDGYGSTPYAPDSATHPLGVYGRTKLEGETAVLRNVGDKAVVVRTAWIYAAAGNNFLRTMLRLMAERGSVRVISDQIGTPTAASSLARALWGIVARPQLHGIFHWTDSGVASWYDFAVAIAEEAAACNLLPAGVQVVPISTAEYSTPAKRPAYSVLDKRSTIAAISMTPEHWRVNLRSVMAGVKNG